MGHTRRKGFPIVAPAARLATMAASIAMFASIAEAADFPTRPIRIVVGFTAGGPTDIPVRFIADKLSQSIGQPVIVEDKPGAASMLATYDVLSHDPDGYTLLACTYFDPVNTLLYKKARYKVSDLAPVSLISRYDYVAAAPKDNPAKTFGDLVQFAKAHPMQVNYGSLGVGSSQNLIGKRLEQVAGIKMTAVPYKGSADAMLEVVAGRLDLFMGPPLSVMPLYENGQVKILATTGRKRLASAPDVPTLSESGVPIVSFGWLGICARAGVPQPVVDLLNSKLLPILKSPDYAALIEKSGSEPTWSTPQEMQKVIDDTVSDAAPLIEQFDLHLD